MKFKRQDNGSYKLTDRNGNKAGKIEGDWWTPSKSRICMTSEELRVIADFIDIQKKCKND